MPVRMRAQSLYIIRTMHTKCYGAIDGVTSVNPHTSHIIRVLYCKGRVAQILGIDHHPWHATNIITACRIRLSMELYDSMMASSSMDR